MKHRMSFFQKFFPVNVFIHFIPFRLSVNNTHDRIEFSILFHHVFLFNDKTVFTQVFTHLPDLGLGLEYAGCQRIYDLFSLCQDLNDKCASHAGGNHRIHFPRRYFAKPVRQSRLNLSFQSVSYNVQSCTLQRSFVNIKGNHL